MYKSMEPKPTNQIKPNIFALPNQMTLLFSLIVVVLLGAVGLGSIGYSPVPIRPIALALLLLTGHAFLANPEHRIAHRKLQPADPDIAELQQEVVALAKAMMLSRTPKLLVTVEAPGIHTFGTWHHWFIALNKQEALQLQASLKHPERKEIVEAQLIHELYHFKTGDYWQMNLTRELLRMMLFLMGWAILFFTGFGFLLIVAGQAVLQLDLLALMAPTETLLPGTVEFMTGLFPSAEEMVELRNRAMGVNLGLVVNFVVSAFFPFIIIAGIIWFFYWPKLWRMRELYADAGVVHVQNKVLPLMSNITRIPLRRLENYPDIVKAMGQNSEEQDAFQRWKRRLRYPRKTHYSSSTRLLCVLEPKRVFDSWQDTAVLLGSLTLLLDILLVSPLTLLYVGQWPMHFTTLVVFVMVALNLIPILVQGYSGWSYMFKVISAVIGLRLIWLLITLGTMVMLFILTPDALNDMLAAGVASTGHFAGYSDDLAFDDLGTFIVQASFLNLAQIVIVYFILLLSLAAIILLLRNLLTWYRFPQAQHRLMKAAYRVIGVGAIGLGMVVLPLTTAVLLAPQNLRNPFIIFLAVLGLLITAVSSLAFLKTHRHYSDRCPQCGTIITTTYKLGNRCSVSTCNELLHPWLIAEYKV